MLYLLRTASIAQSFMRVSINRFIKQQKRKILKILRHLQLKMNQNLLSLGILIIFIGFIIVFTGALSNVKKGDAKFAVGGFVGFIPFGFANDKRMLWVVIGIMSMLVLFFVILPYLFRNQ